MKAKYYLAVLLFLLACVLTLGIGSLLMQVYQLCNTSTATLVITDIVYPVSYLWVLIGMAIVYFVLLVFVIRLIIRILK